jgi:asparagine synthase (glutamine-hydrolysing)
LHFAVTPSATVFASEVKALHVFTCFEPIIDRAAVGEYLRFGYLGEQTSVFQNTYKVRPGTWTRIAQSGQRTEQVYWSIENKSVENRSDQEWTEHIESLIVDSTRLRMISDVPIGVFLSGGIDSALVTALAQKQVTGSLRTFTIGFEVPELNEAEHAKNVAAYLGTTHTEYIMPASKALELLSEWGSLYDEPFGDSSGLPTTLVSRAASEQVKVVLSADGGDELFSGYGRYGLAESRWANINRIPMPLRKGISKALYRLPVERIDNYLADGHFANSRYHRLRYKTTWRGLKLRDQFSVSSAEQLYDLAQYHLTGKAIHELVGSHPYPRRSSEGYAGSSIERYAQWDFDHYLPGDIMTKVDRATMSASIEGREPLLDHRLIEAAFQLPTHLKRGSLGPKHILKDILFRHVPKALLDRPKRGFAVPMEQWLRGPLRALLHDTLMNSKCTFGGVLQPLVVRRYVTRFESGDGALTTPVWLLLAFELWRQGWQPA